MKSRTEVEQLKAQWLEDPSWDLATTPGFEKHHKELKAFSTNQLAIWEKREEDKLLQISEQLGAPGNILLAGYIDVLEDRIEKLEWMIESMKRRSSTHQLTKTA